jgi:Uma2 family endonuclease
VAATSAGLIVSADEYLNSGYHPDREYVEGVLVERDVPSIAHGLLQLILGIYLDAYRKQFRFAVLPEILSPDDRLSEQLARFRDYRQIGVGQMLLLDPEELVAYRFQNGSLIEVQLASLELPTGELPFDTGALFRQLVERRNEGITLS